MNQRSGIIIIVILIILIIAGIFLFSGKSAVTPAVDTTQPGSEVPTGDDGNMGSMDNNATTSETGVMASTTVNVGTPSVKEFTVTGSNFKFTPNTMTVKKGDTVKINFVNSGGLHDFRIDEFNVATHQIQGGQSETVTFVADKAGTFEFYCSVGNHRAMGMKGTFAVTE